MDKAPLTDGAEAQDDLQSRGKKWLMYLLRTLLGLAIAFGLLQIKLDYFDAFLYDLHFRLRPSPTPSGQSRLILIDQNSVVANSGIPGYREHTQVLRRLIQAKPKAIVYVTPLTALNDSEFEQLRATASPQGTPEEREEFLKVLRSFPSIYQVSEEIPLKGEENKLRLPAPFQDIKTLSAPMTRDKGMLADDGVTRRVMIDYLGEPLGHLQLARLLHPELDHAEKLRGAFPVYETRQLNVDFGRPGSLPSLKFEELLKNKQAPKDLKDQIVLIGDDLGKSLKMYISTPFSRDPSAMSYFEMQGNMLETFLRNSAPVPTLPWLGLALTALIAIITLHVVLNLRPLPGLLILGSVAVATLLISHFLFWPFGFWLPLAHPLLAIFICYYFFIPYRLIVENRRSWEYYQKHRLLQQVETLKTNFISMMSHDLKTPIARIHGMTDVIMKDSVALSSTQREALDHIRGSGDDLLRFINSVLNYAKIESEGVQLQTQSRDINELLREVIRKNEFLAKLKGIEIVTEFEEMFSIRLDPELMRQVFSNLLENAIKYSPENSRILVSTEEVDGRVIIQFADQGAGIPGPELPHIFMKFFRSANAKSSPVKGSGLGLYLAKYFVELHQGHIEAESIEGQGSTFTVELPIQN